MLSLMATQHIRYRSPDKAILTFACGTTWRTVDAVLRIGGQST